MASKRSASVGPLVNPFWSERAREEIAIQRSRPVDLPVPSGDEAELDLAIDEGQSVQVNGPGEVGASKGKGISMGGRVHGGVGERFSTPASWEDGKVRVKQGLGFSEEARRTEGEMPEEDCGSTSPRVLHQERDEWQRALERDMVEKLHQENVRLKFEMEQLRKLQTKTRSGGTEGSWSEVSPGEEVMPPPPPRSRSPTVRCQMKQEARFTPQGTRVPDTPPPPDDVVSSSAVPPWPWDFGAYERCEEIGPCSRSWGPSLRGQVRSWSREKLYDRGVGRGMDSRMANGGTVHQGGIHSRHADLGHSGLCDGESTRAFHKGEEVLDAAAAKAAWLQRELTTLQKQLERETVKMGPGLQSSYWKERFVYQEENLGRHGDGRLGGDRAPHGDGRLGGDRAQHGDGRLGGDRAQHGDGRLGDDRAQHGDGRLGGDRAQHGDCRLGGDRAQHGDGRLGDDRAQHGDGRFGGDRTGNGESLDGKGRVQGERGNDMGWTWMKTRTTSKRLASLYLNYHHTRVKRAA